MRSRTACAYSSSVISKYRMGPPRAVDRVSATSITVGSSAMSSYAFRSAEQEPGGQGWKPIVEAYLSANIATIRKRDAPSGSWYRAAAIREREREDRIRASMVSYKDQLVRFMPGSRTTQMRTRVLCELFHDDWSDCASQDAAGPGAAARAGYCKRVLAQELQSDRI